MMDNEGMALPRVCGFALREGGVCSREARYHIITRERVSACEQAFVCMEHMMFVLGKHPEVVGGWVGYHGMAAECGMPGTYYDPLLNCCYEEDEDVEERDRRTMASRRRT